MPAILLLSQINNEEVINKRVDSYSWSDQRNFEVQRVYDVPKIKSKGRIIAVCRSIECVEFYLYACYMIGTMNEAYHYFNYNNTILDLWLYQSYVPHPKQSTRSRNRSSFVSIDPLQGVQLTCAP